MDGKEEICIFVLVLCYSYSYFVCKRFTIKTITLSTEVKQNLQKFPSEKMNVTKNTFFFLSRAPTHYNFTSNSRALYELKRKVCPSKSVCGIFHF